MYARVCKIEINGSTLFTLANLYNYGLMGVLFYYVELKMSTNKLPEKIYHTSEIAYDQYTTPQYMDIFMFVYHVLQIKSIL